MSAEFKHTISWFEIPVNDISRATDFYEKVFEIKLQKEEMDGCKMAIFPAFGECKENEPVVHGALVKMEGMEPNGQGSLVYFNGGNDLAVALSRVEAAGGKIIKDKFSIGPHGHIALFNDTEGNRVAMHSMN